VVDREVVVGWKRCRVERKKKLSRARCIVGEQGVGCEGG